MTNFNVIESDGFIGFLNNVKKNNPVLSQAELLNLVEKMRDGDKKAKEKIILSNFGLVQKIASECRIPGVCFEEKFYAALDKFIQMVEEFNPEVCPYLSSFVWLNVRQAVYDDLLVMQTRLFNLSTKIGKFRTEFETEYGRAPTLAELSEFTGVSERKLSLKLAEIASYNHKSLDAMIGDADSDDGCCAYDFIGDNTVGTPDAELMKEDRVSSVRKALAELSDEDRELITLSYDETNAFGKRLSYREIAEIKGGTYQTVGNHLKIAVKRFKRNLDKYGECA